MSAARGLRPALAFGVLLLLAALPRGGTDVLVSSESGVQFTVPGDPYYHMRRIAWSSENFPRVLSFDRYLNHPHGGRVVWTPAFDWGIAAAARVLAGPDDLAATERVAARAPAVLGTLAVLGVMLLTRRRFSPLAGWVAGGFLALLPNHVLHSQVGQLDHHVAVSLTAVGLLALAMALVAAPRVSLRRAGATGLAFGAALLVWPGLLIHVGLLDAMLVLWVLLAEARSVAIARARALGWVNAGAFVAVTPFAIGGAWTEFGAWSPWVLSNFQPAFLLAAALTLFLAAGAWGAWGASRAGRIGIAAVLGGGGVALAFLAVPSLADVLGVAAGWFAKDESFQQEVRELRPFTPGLAASRYTVLVFAFPVVWAWLAARCWRQGAGADRWLLLGMAGAFLVLAVLQRRFGNTFSIFYVLVWGWLVAEAAEPVRAFWRGRSPGRLPALGLAAVAGLMLLVSLAGFHGPRLRTLARAHANPAIARRGPLSVDQRIYDAGARWLRTESEPTRGWLDRELQPEYGLLTRWDVGHLVRYRSQRPLVQDNFGVYGGRANYEASAAYYAAEDEAAALAILRPLGARYVFADRQGAGTQRPYAPASMAQRLSRDYGSAGSSAAGPELPALQHHRLLWHQRSGKGRSLTPEEKGVAIGIWEVVAGAHVRGRAAPGERVAASLRLVTDSGRPHDYRATTRADAEGAWELVLPYPTDSSWSSAVATFAAYRVESAGQSATLEIPEDAIQAGTPVPGPDLTP